MLASQGLVSNEKELASTLFVMAIKYALLTNELSDHHPKWAVSVSKETKNMYNQTSSIELGYSCSYLDLCSWLCQAFMSINGRNNSVIPNNISEF